MKMVKSLLLGSAAVLVAVAGAQVADIPYAKANPADGYAKVVSVYGAGFFYIPGTDTCIKMNGYCHFHTAGAYDAHGRQVFRITRFSAWTEIRPVDRAILEAARTELIAFLDGEPSSKIE